MDIFKEAKVKFPCIVQPKLDGVNCQAVVNKNGCILFTKSHNEINSIPHINKAIFEYYKRTKYKGTMHIFGELYYHYITFQEIISLVKRKSPHKYSIKIKFFGFEVSESFADGGDLFRVEAEVVENLKDLYSEYDRYLSHGYEGLIYRHKLTTWKLKPLLDDEYEVLEVIEGNGKLKGKAASMRCVTKHGEKFKAKCKGKYPYLATILINKEEIIGKQVTVEYQNLTDRGVPRFGNVKAIRDYE